MDDHTYSMRMDDHTYSVNCTNEQFHDLQSPESSVHIGSVSVSNCKTSETMMTVKSDVLERHDFSTEINVNAEIIETDHTYCQKTCTQNMSVTEEQRQCVTSPVILNCCPCDHVKASEYFNVPNAKKEIQNTCLTSNTQQRYTCCTRFNNVLKRHGRYTQNSVGDGNCYFRCLSLHFFGVEDFHSHIRNRVVSFIVENINIFRPHIILNRHGYTVEQYISNMYLSNSSVSSWATELEIEATATMLQVPVYVLSKFGNVVAWLKFVPHFRLHSPPFPTCPYITIVNTSDHYLLAKPANQLCNCFVDPPVLSLHCNDQNDTNHTPNPVCMMHLDNQIISNAEGDNALQAVMSECMPSVSNDTTCSINKVCHDAKIEPKTINRKRQKLDHSKSDNTLTSVAKGRKQTKTKETVTKKGVSSSSASKFLQKIQEGPNYECASCSKMFYGSTVHTINMLDSWKAILKHLGPPVGDKVTLCTRCLNSLKRNNVPSLCLLNNLQVSKIPPLLQSLNVAEKKMVSLAHTYMKVVILPYGQKAMNGQVINFPYDVQDQIQKFTHRGLVLVKIQGQNKNVIPKEYMVDTEKVLAALTWLKSNNHLYSSIVLPQFDFKTSVPNIVSLELDEQEMPAIDPKNDRNEGWVPETSVILKDPVLPKLNYKLFLDDRHIPVQELPRNVNPPIDLFSDVFVEQMSFPYLFPDGVNGLRTPRNTNLTVLQYFQSRLLSSDTRWQADLSYLFWATSVTEKQKLKEGIHIAKRIRSSKPNNREQPLTAGFVKEHFRTNPDYPEHFYGFMRGIRGSAAYWNASKLDLLALINAKGPMTWFMTLSANDMNWDDLMFVLCQQNKLPHSPEDIKKLTKQQKRDLMISNPVTTARHFCRRVHHLIHSYILSDEKPLGKVIDYFWRIEFQLRGSPHLHSLWWVEDAPDLDTVEGREEAPNFIDKYVTTQVPKDDEMMKRRVEVLQTHHHTHSCKKYCQGSEDKCRFGYPQPIMSTTTMKDLEAMKHSSRCYHIKREPGAEYINPYNNNILRLWNANMDIQLVGSVYGAAKYVCSYICKPECDKISSAIREAVSKLPDESSTLKQLSTIGNIFLTHRQLSAQEAAFKMCGLPLRASSKQTLFINTRPEAERSKLLIPKKHLQSLSDDSENIFCSNIFQRYQSRPCVSSFESMTLHYFASWYVACKKHENAVPLQNESGYVRKRLHQILIRTPKFSLEKDGDLYYYSLLLLYLPWRKESQILEGYSTAAEKFNSCSDLLQCPQSCQYAAEIEVAIKQIQSLGDGLVKNYIAPLVAPNIEAIDNDVFDPEDITREDPDNVHLIAVPPETLEKNFQFEIDATQSVSVNNVEVGEADDVVLNHLMFTRLADHEYYEKIMNLNEGQQAAFDVVNNYFKHLQAFTLGQVAVKPAPIHLFVSGPGGTGKSHLIQLMRECIIRHSLNYLTHDSPAVIVMAPTAMAAFNVNGSTIHSALNLPVQHGPFPKYIPLKGERLARMRELFRNTNSIIIDEISMVSYEMFLQIHLRLNDLKGVSDGSHFGNINVIALGDFYQLPPVSPGSFIFTGQSERTHKWRDLFHIVELKENMRQKEDGVYSDLLNRVRTATHTNSDIQLLKTRLHSDHSDFQSSEESLYLYPTLKKCEIHNNYQVQLLCSLTPVYCIKAKDAFMRPHVVHNKDSSTKTISKSVPVNMIPEDYRECAGLPNQIDLCIGAVVMLCRNIDTKDGLVNGARGKITDFVWEDGKAPESHSLECFPDKILVKFFDSKIGNHSRSHSQFTSDAISIKPITAEFYAKGTVNTVILRTQFPLRLSWAATIHKVQGITLKSAFLDIGSDVFCPGMSYVALSRVKNLKGVHLLCFDESAIKSDPQVEKEMKRIRTFSDSNIH